MFTLDPIIAVRGVHFAATVLACGTVCFMALVAQSALVASPVLRLRLTIVVWIALALTFVSGLAWLVLVAASIMEQSLVEICLHGGLWAVADGTRFGEVTCLRLGVTVLLAALVGFTATRFFQFRFFQFRFFELIAAAVLVGLLAFVGHAGATPGAAGAVHLVSDLVHLLAAAAWLGGLPALAITLSMSLARPANAGTLPGKVAVDTTARFSTLGIVCVAALLVTGVINSYELLSGPGDLVATAYGRLLLYKISLFIVMVAVATVNRVSLTPRLPEPNAVRMLARNSLVEAMLGLCILLLVGALGTMSPSAHVHMNAAVTPSEASEATYVHIHGDTLMADVSIDPGHTGHTTATIRLSREDSDDITAKDVRVTLEPRDHSTQPIVGSATAIPDGSWQMTDLAIPALGVWIVTVTVDTGAAHTETLDAPIVIMQCSNECW